MIDDARILKFNVHSDCRGHLTTIQGYKDIPFDIKRIFYLTFVPTNSLRGGHSHKSTDQVVIALSGSLKIIINDGISARQIVLNRSDIGVFLPRMTWAVLNEFSTNAVCMVLANTSYDPSEYIRNWEEFLSIRGLPYTEEFIGYDYPILE